MIQKSVSAWPFPAFTYSDEACGMISADALRELLARIPSFADASSMNLEEELSAHESRLMSCRGLELTSLAGASPLVLRIESAAAVASGRWIAGRQLRVECHPGDVVFLKERSDWHVLADDTPGLVARESRLELVAAAADHAAHRAESAADLPIARIDASGRLDPWFWPRLARISSHPLSNAAAEALLQLMKTGVVPASRGLQYRLRNADRSTWDELLPLLIEWGEQRFPGRASAIDWPVHVGLQTSDAAWVRAVHRLVAGSDVIASLFPLRMRRAGDAAEYELMAEVAPRRVIEVRGAGESPGADAAFQLEFDVPAADRLRFVEKSACLCIVVQPPTDSLVASRCRVVVRQADAPDRFKEFTPRSEPLLLADVMVDRPFAIELQNGRMLGASLYRSQSS